MEIREEVKKEFKLPNKKVKVRLVNAQRGAISDSNHVLYNLAPGATVEICPRNKKGQSVINCPLNEEERAFFESKEKSGMAFSPGDLSPHAKDKENYWRSKASKVKLDSNPVEYNLADASDYLKYKTLLSNDDLVAPDSASELAKKSYIFVIESDEDAQKKVVVKGDKKKRAWKLAAKMEDDKQGMIDFLSVVGKRPSANSKMEFLIAGIDTFIEENINEFLTVLEDPNYASRVLLTKAIQVKAVKKEGHKYFLADGMELCKKGEINNLASTLNFLSSDENQEIVMVLEAKTSK
jgi:hypothetical protein